jgi:hypothetical protein
MKLRLEMSCQAQDLHTALIEAKKIMVAVDGISCEVKVYHSWEEKSGHGWITITQDCDVMDKMKIYELQKEIAKLKSEKP